jgi:hypothetical protein
VTTPWFSSKIALCLGTRPSRPEQTRNYSLLYRRALPMRMQWPWADARDTPLVRSALDDSRGGICISEEGRDVPQTTLPPERVTSKSLGARSPLQAPAGVMRIWSAPSRTYKLPWPATTYLAATSAGRSCRFPAEDFARSLKVWLLIGTVPTQRTVSEAYAR